MASSVSSTSDGSEHGVATEGDLLADADSMVCRQSNMPSKNDNAGSKMVLYSIPSSLAYFNILSWPFSCILLAIWCSFSFFLSFSTCYSVEIV
jgi:hypothetical protein